MKIEKAKLFWVFLLLVLMPMLSFGQDRKEMETANMNRALEALQAYDYEEAIKYFRNELYYNPKNGYASSWLSYIYDKKRDYANAIYFSEQALKNLPGKDKDYVAFAYSTRGRSYFELEEYDKAFADYEKAIKIAPAATLYEERAEMYYQLDKYDLSDNDYKKLIELEPSSAMGYMGLGRNAKIQDRYDEAFKLFDYVIKLYGQQYSSAYSFRADCYISQGKYSEAADDIVTSLQIDGNDGAYMRMLMLADSAFLIIQSRLKIQHSKEPNDGSWMYYLGKICEFTGKYEKAIGYYKEGYSIEALDVFNESIAECLEECGDYEGALKYAERLVDADSTDVGSLMLRASLNYDLGNNELAIKDVDRCIGYYPDYYWYYHRRGWYNEYLGKYDEAFEDYTSSIVLEPNYSYNYLSRGRISLILGDKAMARKDFQKAVELDTVMENISCAHYAYFYLGDNKKAMQLMDTVLHYNGEDEYYDAACLYSLMNMQTEALDYFKKALESGYCNFVHIVNDRDLDNIRNTEEFKQLVEKYKSIVDAKKHEVAELLGEYEEKIVEVPFDKRNGVTEIKCTINGLPLSFVFDTGASDITISMVEASFMFKNGYLNKKDILGTQNYMTANGEISEGTIINLSNVEIGGLHLSNVRASVVKSQNAPLLFGQTALQRLGKIEIDNVKKVLRITYMEEK